MVELLSIILSDSIHTDYFNTIDSNLAKYVRLLTIYLLDLINLCAT
ncbi:hypothetical protein VCRA2119O147_60054 [Vibrio crassostreae]|uniref:Uncharacterized protein n=1 Tax=Vibrio crassostreae TaxID=246167 RepID=A0A822MYN5_9VIBR|nr:hypothetical protein VCRA2116O28_110035 [Vibrio crassostreae]CAK1716401.1 hypothetical protein VCRA2112O187_100048 [Vibrio crassostreae]CAK1729063.1 hypothetical protein VCRA2116O27_120037 [Vibrio crassostreae]CAK1745927.1 hypothetical protein VCRA2113O120_130074 [Vibrio crassostreae]CAK1753237.1 hypothetical protein VCRA2116O26_130101 [Vibrio crassostreae]